MNKLAATDKLIAELDEARKVLDAALREVESIDKRIAIQENILADLEKAKQIKLDNVRDLFELAITNSHRLPNGYEIKVHGKRPITVTDVAAFLKWLKLNFQPDEVMKFFVDSLKTKALQKFVENYCDNERLKGNMKPTVEGVDIEAINFRRLTTSYNTKERKK